MSIKNKFLLFFSIIILAFITTLVFLLFRTEDMIVKSLYNDFAQIANSTIKEIDSFLLNCILSLETLSHNEGIKMQIIGMDDTKNIYKEEEMEDIIGSGKIIPVQIKQMSTGSSINIITNSGVTENVGKIVHKNISTKKILKETKNTPIEENQHLQEVLKDFISINSTFHSVEFISTSGQTIAYISEETLNKDTITSRKLILKKLGRDRTMKKLFIEAKSGDKSYYIEDVVREDDGNVTIDIAVPIYLEQYGNKIFIGVIIGDINMIHIWKITDKIKIGTTGEVMLYNKSGFTIADPYKEKILTHPKIIVPSIEAILRGEHGETVEISEMGTESITAYAPLPGYQEYKGLGWGIQVTQDIEEAFKSIRTFTMYGILLMGVIILLVLFFVYLIHTQISSPIIRLAQAAKEIGSGNYLVDMENIVTSISSCDEINLLAQTFRDMLFNLRVNINLMEQYKHTIDESSLVSKTDLRGLITYANKQFCETAQYTETELIGKSHNIVRHPDMQKETFKDLWDTISAKKIWRGIIKNRAKDGSDYWVTVIIAPILDIDGNIFEYMSIRTDITELQNTKIQLAESFKKLQENTEALIEGKRISHEFELAKNIQETFLPTVTSDFLPYLDTYCVVHPATEIGGDLYDIIPSASKDEYLIYIGDVTGHGLISGIIMAIISSLVYTFNREVSGNIQLLLFKLNNVVMARIPSKMFVTMLFMKYKPATKTFSYMGAGHERFLIYRKESRKVEIIPSRGIAIGMFANMFTKDVSKEFTLASGDILLLYTDGITEAKNAKEELFGVNRLAESLSKYQDNSSAVLCDNIFADIKEFVQSDIFVDDITMMAFRAE